MDKLDVMDKEISDAEKAVTFHEEQALAAKLWLDRIRQQRTAMLLDNYWATHSGLRVNEGDSLLITTEWLHYKRKRGADFESVGDVLMVVDVVWDNEAQEPLYYIKTAHTEGWTELAYIQAMRQAWLDRGVETIEKG